MYITADLKKRVNPEFFAYLVLQLSSPQPSIPARAPSNIENPALPGTGAKSR
jgi:hypothetical protein